MQNWLTISIIMVMIGLRYLQTGPEKFKTAELKTWELIFSLTTVLVIDFQYGIYFNTIFFGCGLVLWAFTFRFSDPEYGKGQLKIIDLFYAYALFAVIVLYSDYVAPYITSGLDHFQLVNNIQALSAKTSALGQWVIYIVVSEFFAYFSHRLMHTKYFWKFHALHHAPEGINWLSGQRGTIVHGILLLLPYTIAANLFIVNDPEYAVIARAFFDSLNQSFIHSNLKIPYARRWEKIFVTPRAHLIHHNHNSKISSSNYCFVFTIFDRLFGTYVDPDDISDKRFGIDEKLDMDPISMVLGFDLSKLRRLRKLRRRSSAN